MLVFACLSYVNDVAGEQILKGENDGKAKEVLWCAGWTKPWCI